VARSENEADTLGTDVWLKGWRFGRILRLVGPARLGAGHDELSPHPDERSAEAGDNDPGDEEATLADLLVWTAVVVVVTVRPLGQASFASGIASPSVSTIPSARAVCAGRGWQPESKASKTHAPAGVAKLSFISAMVPTRNGAE
jgi:hypothetical protein